MHHTFSHFCVAASHSACELQFQSHILGVFLSVCTVWRAVLWHCVFARVPTFVLVQVAVQKSAVQFPIKFSVFYMLEQFAFEGAWCGSRLFAISNKEMQTRKHNLNLEIW